MAETIPAIFDAGVFRPLTPVDLANGTPVEVQVSSIVSKGIHATGNAGSVMPSELTAQRAQIDEMLSEIEQLPIEEPDDGFSGRDHDQALYGKR